MTTTKSTEETTHESATGESRIGIPISGDDARAAVEAISRSAPEVAQASRNAMVDAMAWVERSSDDRVATGATLSLGLALGMLIGGAPRLLIALALVPVAALGMVVLDRRRRTRTTT